MYRQTYIVFRQIDGLMQVDDIFRYTETPSTSKFMDNGHIATNKKQTDWNAAINGDLYGDES